jgi:hypothetical protein
MLRFFLGIGCLAAVMVVAPTASAQAQSPDFGDQVQPTLPANELLVGQIHDALPSANLDQMTGQTMDTVGLGQDLEQRLGKAMALAPDDASRSRLEGVRTHTVAALDALRLVQLEPTLDAARSRLEQARGEAQEGLDELRPFVLGLVISGDITGK